MRDSSSWLRVFILSWHRLSQETIADCSRCSQKGLVLAGRLPVSKLAGLCEERACAVCEPDFQVSFLTTISLITTCDCVRNLHRTETKNTAKRVWGRSKESEEAQKSRRRVPRRLLKSLDQNAPDSLRVTRWTSASLPHTSDLVNSLRTATLGNLNHSTHPTWGALLAGTERM